MGDAQFRTLLDALPQIEESVSKFESEAVQQQVIEGLLTALLRPVEMDDADAEESASEYVEPTPAPIETSEPSPNGQQTKATQPKKKKSKSLPRVDAVDFNWAPDGVESLADFIERKQPRTNVDRNLAVVFYLEEIAKHSPITVGHIVSGFYAADWDVPANPRNALSVARSQTKGVDTSDLNNILITHIGRNIVNKQLPRPSKAK